MRPDARGLAKNPRMRVASVAPKTASPAATARMAELHFDTSGVPFWNALRQDTLGNARDGLDESVVAALDAEGRAMGWDAARTEALTASGH